MLNPITYTEKIVGDFLRYQLTTYPFADKSLNAQMRRLLSLEYTRATPLLKGPYISLSRSFRRGAAIKDLVKEGLLHPHLAALAPHQQVFGHQETAIRAIATGRTTLISTGTGSGKTECFLYPIISHCLKLRDKGAPPGIAAVIVYPMNALAEDQLERLRALLVGTGISFALYVGKTPERKAEVPGVRLRPGASRADYQARIEQMRRDKQSLAVHPPEELVSREEIRAPGKQPRILLTNVKQLELLLTRQQDYELFNNARLDYLVFDEAHTFSGTAGAETACLIRRLRAYCGKEPEETICVATSATLADPERGPEAGRLFAARFFGVRPEQVALVGEEYEPDPWAPARSPTPPLPGDPRVQLQTILDAVAGVEQESPAEAEEQLLRSVFQTLTGASLDPARWQESLHERLAANEVVYQIAQALKSPRPLAELVEDLREHVGRAVPEEELLAWLALGAASRQEGRPLLRPVVHAFVRGVSGAVFTFPLADPSPRLWLSAEEAEAEDELYRLPALTCTTCGQHYFVHYLADFNFTGKRPGGGEAVGDQVIWRPLEESSGGRRVVLLDRLVLDEEKEEEEQSDPRNTLPLSFCRYCGTLHSQEQDRCAGCGKESPLVLLYAVQQREDHPGHLTRCVACGALGRQHVGAYREPARPVRALAVADVHVLAQSMIQHAERRRLLVFADNRQDAAFQAGWMQDHARRYRLRALSYERLRQSPASVGDLTTSLDELLDQDDDLSRVLIPEVWGAARKEAAGHQHAEERKRFLRIQVLRELTTGLRQRIGLEPWGRLVVDYLGLDADLPFFAPWSDQIGCTPEALREGVASLLDIARRSSRLLLDREGQIFSRFWHESDREVQRGYLPVFQGGPKGLKLRREEEDDGARVSQWLSSRGSTLAQQAARRWGVDPEHLDRFFEELWKLLTEELGLLVPVTLTGARGRPLPRCAGVRQLDADKLLLRPHAGVYRCDTCRRVHLRPTPQQACMAWRCPGSLNFAQEDPDDYDLMVLDQGFAMLRPREHSAQIPPDERELLERTFKGEGESVNTLVCTPTLELGVDIGALDAVLMRNVPPLPANYWQRAGRAGRRHRMAVNLTYARPASHDRAYFVNPLKMLQGLICPPSFNLKNEVMVRKHVHAAALTLLHRLARDERGLPQSDREEIVQALKLCFPPQVKDYLFDTAGSILNHPFDFSSLARVVTQHQTALLDHIRQVFGQGWPVQDAEVVREEALEQSILAMGEELAQVIQRLARRLRWALDQMSRLEEARRRKGTLDPEEDALRARCDRLVKRLKGIQTRRRQEAEGYDDTHTYAVLAAEGFLPGYGLDTGWVVGFHQAPLYSADLRDWELRRNPALALREYVPGNLIYANGHRFIPRFFHLETVDPTLFQVDVGHEAIREVGAAAAGASVGLGGAALQSVPICDVDLPHHSHISDEEDYRFQLSVAVYGYERDQHGGGKAYTWGDRTLTHRTAVRLRLVNVGPAGLVQGTGRLGYPLCLVCGQSRSPLASQADRDQFAEDHRERCGKKVEPVGFYADIVADALTLQGGENRSVAYSVMEALRRGAAEVLEMEVEDLQLLAAGRAGEETTDMVLYDPMPGGSGLLEQMISRWDEVVQAALSLVRDCPSACASACIDCLLDFRNAHYHRHLHRHLTTERLEAWGDRLIFSHDIPPRLPTPPPEGQPVNNPEEILRILLERAGFHSFLPQHPIDLGRPLGTTTPDFFFEDPTGHYQGVCIYLDGMSTHLHGNPQTQKRDRQIREELRARFYEVFEIPYGQLTDRDAMRRHFLRLGHILLGRERVSTLRDDPQWPPFS